MAGIFKQTGLVKLAIIEKVYPDTMTADISFTNNLGNSSLRSGNKDLYRAQLPISYLSVGGAFIGGMPSQGTPVAVCQGESGYHFYIIAFLVRDPANTATVSPSKLNIPPLSEGKLTIQAHQSISIDLSKDLITIGDLSNSLSLDTDSRILTNTFSNSYTFSEGTKEVMGVILRDRNLETNAKEIGLDPVANTASSTYGEVARNPPRVEKREVVFEYEKVAQVRSNIEEVKGYNKERITTIPGFINRRDSQNDTLSLSLVYPNHLMETVKGTVVDIYGNILDLNRNKIPIGDGKTAIINIKSSLSAQDSNKNTYEEIKRLERKSIAYHFEMNARKEVEKTGAPDPSNQDNYARDRSRFFLDIDKEGQLKLNVPSSSSSGNVPLLTRYENYTTVNPNTRSKDPNDVAVNPDQKDILIEGFSTAGPMRLVDDTDKDAGPVDRFSNEKSPKYIGHGTAYHDISRTIRASTEVQFYKPSEYESTTRLDSGDIEPIKEVVSQEIIVSGTQANGGGRSGSLNFDGSIDLNIGRNEVDEQSLWVDTEGGVVANIGEDKNGMSVAASLDGNVFLELGNTDTHTDDTSSKVFDLKVSDGVGNMTVFRIDETGLSITTQGRVVMYSSGDMMFRSAAGITMDAENVIINGRSVIKNVGAGPVR